MSFHEEFLKTKPGPAREQLVYNAIINQGPPKDLVPITVTNKDGVKITYRVMKDYVMIDGIRVPMSGITAQRVADHFGMNLPTPKIVDQVYQAADTKLKATPMSAGGMIGGKYYSGKQVVDSKISDSDTSVAFNERINNQLKDKNPNLVSGHMKEITAPEAQGKLGLYGLYGPDGKPIQNSAITPHDITGHTEYASGVRLVSDKVTVTMPDNTVKTMSMEQVLADPSFSKMLSLSGKLKRYSPKENVKKPEQVSPEPIEKNEPKKSPTLPEKSQARISILERIDKFLSSLKF